VDELINVPLPKSAPSILLGDLISWAFSAQPTPLHELPPRELQALHDAMDGLLTVWEQISDAHHYDVQPGWVDALTLELGFVREALGEPVHA